MLTKSDTEIFANLRGTAPDELIDFLAQIVGFFPERFRLRVRQVMESLPPEGDNMDRVLELIRYQWRGIQARNWVKIALVGSAHTGKETLLRAIRRREISAVEPIFSVVEPPGLDEYLGYGKSIEAPPELRQNDILLLVLDGRYGISGSTVQVANRLKGLGKPLLVLLNKIDLVEKPREVVKEARKRLGMAVVPVSAVSERSIDQLFGAVASADARALYPLTQTFPGFRDSICTAVTTQAALASALVGGLRIPVSDLLPLTAIQTGMLLKIARAYGHELGWRRVRELGPMLFGNLAVRGGTNWLASRFPGQRTLIEVTAAGSWTFALGKIAVAYFERFSNLLLLPAGEPVAVRPGD